MAAALAHRHRWPALSRRGRFANRERVLRPAIPGSDLYVDDCIVLESAAGLAPFGVGGKGAPDTSTRAVAQGRPDQRGSTPFRPRSMGTGLFLSHLPAPHHEPTPGLATRSPAFESNSSSGGLKHTAWLYD